MSTEDADARFSFLAAFARTVCAGLPSAYLERNAQVLDFIDTIEDSSCPARKMKHVRSVIRSCADQVTTELIDTKSLSCHFRVSKVKAGHVMALHVLLSHRQEEDARLAHIFTAIAHEKRREIAIYDQKAGDFDLNNRDSLLQAVGYFERALKSQLPILLECHDPHQLSGGNPNVSQYINQCLSQLSLGPE